MHRFKISAGNDGFFEVEGAEFHHLSAVLRLGVGAAIRGFDDTGNELTGEIVALTPARARCRVLSTRAADTETAARVYLVMGLAKGDKMEWVIQKGTELGMTGLVPLATERSVVRLDAAKSAAKLARWQKIAAEAVKQCGRVRAPMIFPVSDWKGLPAVLPEDTQYILFYEEEKENPLRAELAAVDRQKPLALIVGAEGGLTPKETDWARTNLAARQVSLGPRVLRTETAALTALALTLYETGELG